MKMKDRNSTLGRIKAEKYQKLSERLQSNLDSGNWNSMSSRNKQNLLLRKARYEKHLQMLGLAVAITGGSAYGNEIQAQCETLTAENQVNIFATNDQNDPDVAMDANGNYVVVWESETGEYTYNFCYGYSDNDGSTIFARIFDSNGVPTSSEIVVASPTTSTYHDDPSISMDANGNFVVVWETEHLAYCGSYYGSTVDLAYAKVFNSSGMAITSDILVSETTSIDNDDPDVAMDANGNFVVVWERQAYSDACMYSGYSYIDVIYARTFNAAGTPDGPSFPINDQQSVDSDDPFVAVDANGNWVAAWETDICDNYYYDDVFAKVFDSSNIPTTSEILVNTTTGNNHEDVDVAMAANGDFIVAWEADYNQDGDEDGVFMRKFNLAGVAQSAEIQINDNTTDDQADVRIAMDSEGNFIAAWQAGNDQDGDSNGVYYKLYNSACVALTAELQINEETSQSQDDPVVAINDNGNIAFAWESNNQDGDDDGVFTRTTFCPPVAIPTMGQWGIFILGLLTSILGLVGIKQKEKEKRKIFIR